MTKIKLIKHLCRPSREFGGAVDCRVVKRRLVGDALWTVVEANAPYGPYIFEGESFMPNVPRQFIRVHALKGEGWDRWTHQSWWEKDHPRLYSCPLSLLAETGEVCPEWRAGVRAWHADKTDPSKWKQGDVIMENKPCGWTKGKIWDPPRYRLLLPTEEGGWLAMGIAPKVGYRLSRDILEHASRIA